MFSITLITMGKLKEKFYISAAEEYKKRLGGYCAFTLLELPEARLPENPSPGEIEAGLEKEAELIFSKIPKGSWLCVLTPEGKELSSEAFCGQAPGREKFRQVQRLLFDWLLLRHVPPCQAAGRFPPLHGGNDLSPPSGADHGSGTALPGRSHSGGKQVS